MIEVQLFYRDGDVGDGPRWEASVSDVDGAGVTPGEALEALHVALIEREPVVEPTPEPVNLEAIADALGVDVSKLEAIGRGGGAPAGGPGPVPVPPAQ